MTKPSQKVDKRHLFVILILIVVGLTLYLPSLNNQFVSDDVGGILKNSNIGNPQTITNQPFSFLQPLIYFIIYKLLGLNPVFFRLPNIIFHVSSSITLYAILILLTSFEVAILSSLLFLIHPLTTEAVVWISAGSYPRYSFFLLLSFFFFLLDAKKKRVKWYFFSLISFTFGLLSSEKALAFPLILLSFSLLIRSVKTNLKRLVPYFILALLFIIPLVLNIGTRISETSLQYGSGDGLYSNPFIQIPLSVSTYLLLLFWPDKLELFHQESALTFSNIAVFLAYLSSLVFFFFKNRTVFIWLMFFFTALLPTLLPIKIASVIAERYAYFASIGIFVSAAYVLHAFVKEKKLKLIIYPVIVIILLILTAKTVIRITDWKNEETLAVSGSRTSAKKLSSLISLGNMYARQRNYQEAIKYYSKAKQIAPSYAKAYNNLGYAYSQIGEFNLAVAHFEKGLQINPNMWEAYDNLAAVYTSLKQYDKALDYIEKAIKLSNHNNDLYLHKGIVYMRRGDKEKAKQNFKKVIEFDPGNVQAKSYLKSIE